MASETEDAEAAAERLEAALERIAQATAREAAMPGERNPPAGGKELAARLDALIDRLRTALGDRGG
jgi:hypothetical protein